MSYQTYYWEPSTPIKGLMVGFHGLNGHTLHSASLAKALANKGIVYAGYDYKNFGAS